METRSKASNMASKQRIQTSTPATGMTRKVAKVKKNAPKKAGKRQIPAEQLFEWSRHIAQVTFTARNAKQGVDGLNNESNVRREVPEDQPFNGFEGTTIIDEGNEEQNEEVFLDAHESVEDMNADNDSDVQPSSIDSAIADQLQRYAMRYELQMQTLSERYQKWFEKTTNEIMERVHKETGQAIESAIQSKIKPLVLQGYNDAMKSKDEAIVTLQKENQRLLEEREVESKMNDRLTEAFRSLASETKNRMIENVDSALKMCESIDLLGTEITELKEQFPTAEEIAEEVINEVRRKDSPPEDEEDDEELEMLDINQNNEEKEDSVRPKGRRVGFQEPTHSPPKRSRQSSPPPVERPVDRSEGQPINRLNWNKLPKIENMANFEMSTDAIAWIESFQRKATYAQLPRYVWPSKMGNYIGELREEAFHRFFEENKHLIDESSDDWWSTFKTNFIERFGSSDRKIRAIQSLEKLKFEDYKKNEKSMFFEDCMRFALRTGDKTAETIGYKILEKLDENLYRQISSNSQDLFRLPIDLFIEKVKGAWIGEELIRSRRKPSGRVGDEDYGKSGKSSHLNEDSTQTKNSTSKGPVCFECQKSGHFKKQCPRIRATTPKELELAAIEYTDDSGSGNGKVGP